MRSLSRPGLAFLFLLSGLGTLACGDLAGIAGTQQLPSGTPSPSVYSTPAGALALYEETVTGFQFNLGSVASNGGTGGGAAVTGPFVDYMLISGLFTDELQAGDLGCQNISCTVSTNDAVDARHLTDNQPNPTDMVYGELQAIRNTAGEGIGALTAYDPTAPPALRGHLAALAGYAEILLADLFCSGIPLSTLDFGADFTYARGDTTDEVYRDAVAKFNQAIVLADSSDSSRIKDFALVGKGRAWLALGQYDSAAAAVATVPDDFVYSFLVDWSTQLNPQFTSFNYTEADTEGGTGLPYISSGDPRVAAQVADSTPISITYNADSGYTRDYWPNKYGGNTPGVIPIHVADGIEARLIQAEAALSHQSYTTWLQFLNAARAQAMPSLAPLTDPGPSPNDGVRVALQFRERAFDLFLTGHRQGDLRRLLRQYKTLYPPGSAVYPMGPYPLSQAGAYGNILNAPIPPTESVNPLFHGCLSRGA